VEDESKRKIVRTGDRLIFSAFEPVD